MRRRFCMVILITFPCLGQRFPRPPRPRPKPPVRQPKYDPPVKNVPSGPGGKEPDTPNKKQRDYERKQQEDKRNRDKGKPIQPKP